MIEKTVCANIKFFKEVGYPIKIITREYCIKDMMISSYKIAFVKNSVFISYGVCETEKRYS